MLIKIKVIPNAKRNQLASFAGGVLKIHLASPPVDGKANKALLEFLAKMFIISKSSVRIVKGEKVRGKLVEISGLKEKDFLQRVCSSVG